MRWAALIFALALPFGVAAQESSVGQLRSDISLLRDQLADIQALILTEGNGSLTPSMGPALIRLDQVEQDLRRLTGQLETLEREVDQTIASARAKLDAIEVRIDALDGQGPVEIPVRDGVSAAELTAFETAVGLGLTDAGRKALGVFLEDYPTSTYALDARLRMASIAAKSGDAKAAAEAYLEVFSRDPRGPLSGQALLGMGEAFAALGNVQEACLMYFELETRAPTPALLKTAKAQSAALACD